MAIVPSGELTTLTFVFIHFTRETGGSPPSLSPFRDLERDDDAPVRLAVFAAEPEVAQVDQRPVLVPGDVGGGPIGHPAVPADRSARDEALAPSGD